MTHWMRLLSNHYMEVQSRYPGEKLMILFDIDGTILDMRHLILYVLRRIDSKYGTEHFANIMMSDITFHEEHMELFLDGLDLTLSEKERILSSYRADFWRWAMAAAAHKAFDGVLEIIRLFQLQPNTFVGLNTGRPEILRFNTLHSLNRLGKELKIHLPDDMLHMKPDAWEEDITLAKVMGVQHYRTKGYRIFAAVDNEPENLEAIARHFDEPELLLLHVDTISKSTPTLTHRRIVSGESYDLDEFMNGFDDFALRRSA